MGTLIPWIEVTIPGFVYLTACVLILLRVFKIESAAFDKEETLNKIKIVLPYVSVIIAFASYVVGFIVQLLTSWTYNLMCGNGTSKMITGMVLQGTVSDKALHSYNGDYGNLILVRHLFLSTLFLGLSLKIWLKGSFKKPNCKLVSVFTILLAVLGWAYFIYKADYECLQKRILEGKYPAQQVQQK